MAIKVPTFGARHVQVLLMFLGLVAAYALRVNLSVAIVSMTDKNSTDSSEQVFNWDTTTKSTILGSFFWGYVITQVPAGELAHRYGPKMFLVVGVTLCSLFTLLTPVAAQYGDWPWVCAVRMIQGLGQGFVFPSIHTLLAKWAPLNERGRLATFVYAGSQMGTIIGLPISGWLASDLGWPSIFYFSGVGGLLWCAAWFLWGCDSPAKHNTITQAERKYIEDSLYIGKEGEEEKDHEKEKEESLPTPWYSILTSLPMWSIIIAHCTQNWGFWTLLTEMPSFMDNILNFDIKANGLLSALPYFAMWLSSFFFSWASDFINQRKLLSLAASRKLFNSIAHWIPGLALIGLGYTRNGDRVLAVSLLTLAVGVNSGTYLGFQLNHIDLSPNFAGTMMGITNGAANVFSIIGPQIVGLIVTDEKDASQWRIVFFIASGIYFVGNLFFVIFGKAEIQPWNDPSGTTKKDSIPMDEQLEKPKKQKNEVHSNIP